MRRGLFCSFLLMLSVAMFAHAADTASTTPDAAPAPVTTSPVTEIQPPPERPKPAEKPVEKPTPRPAPAAKPAAPAAAAPKPAKPAPAPSKPVETAKTPEATKPGEPAATVNPPPSAETATRYGCWILAFAMLIAGFAAGFFWRHQMSRRKLGGMSVRIGTWRGIP